MEKILNTACSNALKSADKLPALESIYKLLGENKALVAPLAQKTEFLLVVMEVITGAFYQLNTDEFDRTKGHSVEVCVKIMLLLVDDPGFKKLWIDSQLDVYMYPFLVADSTESLRIAILLLFHEILRDGMPFTMHGGELLPLLLKNVGFGSERLRWLSLNALHLILQGPGLDYAVQTLDRFHAIDMALSKLFHKCVVSKNADLLKSLFKIYIRLCDKSNVRQKLKEKLPEGILSREAQLLAESDRSLADLRTRFLQLVK
ncbi:CCR4-NOT transcription complex subunit 9 [Pancytospora philotis]|nr:CCR4-NOT transcription complex subunit 9 [Pancytospora philotis]